MPKANCSRLGGLRANRRGYFGRQFSLDFPYFIGCWTNLTVRLTFGIKLPRRTLPLATLTLVSPIALLIAISPPATSAAVFGRTAIVATTSSPAPTALASTFTVILAVTPIFALTAFVTVTASVVALTPRLFVSTAA